MLTLAVFADDLTGALDTGVQFAASGVKNRRHGGDHAARGCTVAVCDLETRHLSPAEAAAPDGRGRTGRAGARRAVPLCKNGLRPAREYRRGALRAAPGRRPRALCARLPGKRPRDRKWRAPDRRRAGEPEPLRTRRAHARAPRPEWRTSCARTPTSRSARA